MSENPDKDAEIRRLIEEVSYLKQHRDNQTAWILKQEQQRRMLAKVWPDLVAFAKEVIGIVWEGGSLDGGEIQRIAEVHRLIRPVPYDPAKHGPSTLSEKGDPWYEFVGPLRIRD